MVRCFTFGHPTFHMFLILASLASVAALSPASSDSDVNLIRRAPKREAFKVYDDGEVSLQESSEAPGAVSKDGDEEILAEVDQDGEVSFDDEADGEAMANAMNERAEVGDTEDDDTLTADDDIDFDDSIDQQLTV